MTDDLKIATEKYREQVRIFWTRDALILFVFGLAVISAVMWGLAQFFGGQPLDTDWRIVSVIFTVSAMVPCVLVLHPDKPTQESVAYDKLLNELGRELRKQHLGEGASGN